MLNNLLKNPNHKIALFDLETCNLNLATEINKPWQLGLIICEGGQIKEKHNKYIWWDNLPMSASAARVTRFDYEKYKSLAKPADEALELLDSYLYNPEYIVMGHNILGFDVYVHNIWRKLLGKPVDYSYNNRLIDTNAIARGIKMGLPYNNGSLLAYQYSAISIKKEGIKTNLTALGKENKIEYDYENLHDGLNDCILNFQVWNKYIKNKFKF